MPYATNIYIPLSFVSSHSFCLDLNALAAMDVADSDAIIVEQMAVTGVVSDLLENC